MSTPTAGDTAMPTRRTLLTLLAAAAATACSAPPALAVGSLVDLQVIDRGRNETLPAYRHRGASYVAGKPGERYAVRMTNRSGGRVLVVLSVDGVNAVSGETAATGQTGYVLAPWQSAEITGWRKSYSEAAAFYFTALTDSYAARTDRPDNVGVIGAAVFRERVEEPLRGWLDRQAPVARERADRGADKDVRESERRAQSAGAADSTSQNAAAPPAASMAQPERDAFAKKAEKLGTGHGEREYSPTRQTAFERASSQPAEIVQVRYDSYVNLLASGVIARPRLTPRFPDAFPGFVADPG
ncbi:MAG: hypothetical protein ABIO71_10725 [Caldimonas sp.]